MSNKEAKLTVPEIIDYCKNELGITFNIMDEQKAQEFLHKNNYFFRIKQYAEICVEKTKNGKYKGLDFGHLVELSTIDMFLRKNLLKMTIDLEHYLKVNLVNDCQTNEDDDGYGVVKAFLSKYPYIQKTITRGGNFSCYSGMDIEACMTNPAVWNIVELLGFYDFTLFYSFYYDYFHLKSEYKSHIDSIRRIRNAAAHNSCMLCNFKPVSNFAYDVGINFDLLDAGLGISPGLITSCLKVPLLNDFAVMLSVYTKLLTSPKVKQKTFEEMKEFFDDRMILHKEYFEGFSNIKNAYKFARAVLDYYSN
ncbi:MAG: Abi family protein [Treponema sp.]|nr:Abi family protein [Treponema sp.]